MCSLLMLSGLQGKTRALCFVATKRGSICYSCAFCLHHPKYVEQVGRKQEPHSALIKIQAERKHRGDWSSSTHMPQPSAGSSRSEMGSFSFIATYTTVTQTYFKIFFMNWSCGQGIVYLNVLYWKVSLNWIFFPPHIIFVNGNNTLQLCLMATKCIFCV